jgi:hypothetical protein
LAGEIDEAEKMSGISGAVGARLHARLEICVSLSISLFGAVTLCSQRRAYVISAGETITFQTLCQQLDFFYACKDKDITQRYGCSISLEGHTRGG